MGIMGLEPIRNYPLISKISLSTISAYPTSMNLDRLELSTSRLSSVHSNQLSYRSLNPMRIELIFLTWKVNVLPLDEGFYLGVLGLEPKTSGLRDHCSTNWAIQVGIIGLEPIIMGSKPTALPFGYIPAS